MLLNRRPHMAFFGSSLVSAYWNGAATYYRGIIRALHDRGWQITFYEPDAYGRQEHRDILPPVWADIVVYGGQHEDSVYSALQAAGSADIVVKASGVGQYDELLEQEVLSLKRPDNLVLFWDVDAPATLERVHGDDEDPFRSLISQYDMILTYGGGEPVIQAYTELGARACHPIYNALDPLTHYPVASDSRFSGLCGFLGNRLPDRERRVEEFFLEPAARMSDQWFLLGGSGWQDKAMPANVRCLGHVYTRDHNAFNSSPRAVLNINRQSMAATGFSPPTRIFEAAGAAACLITDTWDGIEMFLEPGKEVLLARDAQEIVEQLQSLSPSRAKAIGRAAYRRVLAEHTYSHRADQVLQILDVAPLQIGVAR